MKPILYSLGHLTFCACLLSLSACPPDLDDCTKHPECDEQNRICPDEEGLIACGSCVEGYQEYGDEGCRPSDPCDPNPCTEELRTQCINDQGVAECTCDFESCLDTCCGESQVCLWNEQCGPEETKISMTDQQLRDNFGYSVAISGNVAIVGSPFAENGGEAYVYEHENGAWELQQILKATYENETETFSLSFGTSVAISGNVAIVGSVHGCAVSTFWVPCGGAVVIYRYQNGSWLQDKVFSTAAIKTFDRFGQSVSISGDVAIVGGATELLDEETIGVVYLYRYQNGDWVQAKKLFAEQTMDRFGASVSISDDAAIVGRPDTDPDSFGAVYVYRYENEDWVEEQQLIAPEEYGFGSAVSINGNLAIVGSAELVDGKPNGSAYIYRFESGNWFRKKKLIASDTHLDNGFGSAVSISGDVAIVGAPYADSDQNTKNGPGAAYIYVYQDEDWLEKQKQIASDGQALDQFGFCVAISDSAAIVGAPKEDGQIGDPNDKYDGPGATYFY